MDLIKIVKSDEWWSALQWDRWHQTYRFVGLWPPDTPAGMIHDWKRSMEVKYGSYV